MKINEILLNILLATVGFLVVFTFKQIEVDIKSVQAQLTDVQIQLREIQVKQESYVTEAKVREIIREYHNDLQNIK